MRSIIASTQTSPHDHVRRYGALVTNGTKNPAYSAVSRDVSAAILQEPADDDKPAIYWPKEEQIKRMEAVYAKYESQGIWSAKARDVRTIIPSQPGLRIILTQDFWLQTHREEMKHVRKGCLTRDRNDVKSDGSRIEGTHKAWNSLNRAFSSGLMMMVSMGHDFVLRRNVRLAFNGPSPSPFIASTFGSHHIGLVDNNARLWNHLREQASPELKELLNELPRLPAKEKESGEQFGLVLEEGTEASKAFKKNFKAEEDSELEIFEDDEVEGVDENMSPSKPVETIDVAAKAQSKSGATSSSKPAPSQLDVANVPMQYEIENTNDVEGEWVGVPEARSRWKGKGKAVDLAPFPVNTQILNDSLDPFAISTKTGAGTITNPFLVDANDLGSGDLNLLDEDESLQLAIQLSALDAYHATTAPSPQLQSHCEVRPDDEPFLHLEPFPLNDFSPQGTTMATIPLVQLSSSAHPQPSSTSAPPLHTAGATACQQSPGPTQTSTHHHHSGLDPSASRSTPLGTSTHKRKPSAEQVDYNPRPAKQLKVCAL